MALLLKFAERSRIPPGSEHIASIVANLNNVLNTKRDYGSFLPNFGIGDLSGHQTREDVARAVIGEVRECIELHEPRVHLNEIVYENDSSPLRLSFTIRCTIKENAQALKMFFDTVFGKVSVGQPRAPR